MIGLRAQQAHVVRVHWTRTHDGTHDLRHFGVVALADVHVDQVLEIDPLQMLEITGHEMAARLLAIAQDVDTRALLVANREPGRIAFGLA